MSALARAALTLTVLAGGGTGPAALASDPPAPPPPTTAPEDSRDDESDERDPEPAIREHVVVSASAFEQTLLDAPAAVDVLTGDDLELRAADGIGDQLRRVPGLNVVQFSARDVNIASRGASGGINNSTLALADGRSLYQDFLGFVMWEFAPTQDASIVEQIEIVRGPASSVWGANAVGGVINVRTKSPRDTPGGRLRIGAGNYASRRVDFRQSVTRGPWSLRLSTGYREQDAFARPQTVVNMFGETIDPDLGLLADDVRDSGTRQPRIDLRADRDGPDDSRWMLQAGWGRTRGWIATGLGPFDVDPGTSSSFVQGRYTRGAFEAQVVTNFFDGSGRNLINGILFDFTAADTKASVASRHVLGSRAVVGWGAEIARSVYDLSIAPEGERRTKAGGYGEIDVGLHERVRFVAGLRADHVRETIGTVFSPRLALRVKPAERHTLRAAWGEAFRSPSVIESDLLVPAIPVAILNWNEIDGQVFGTDPDTGEPLVPFFSLMTRAVCDLTADNCGAPPGEIPDYVAVTAAEGTRGLEEERTSSIELGYAGRFGPIGLSVSLYRTRSIDGIDFPQVATYGFGVDGVPGTADDVILPSDPDGDGTLEAPPIDVCFGASGIPPFDTLCAVGPVPYNTALSLLLDGLVPARFAYRNSSTAINRGVELGLTWFARHGLSGHVNWSWQDDPRADGVPMRQRIDIVRAETAADADLDGDGLVADVSPFVNIPAKHRISVGAQIDRRRWFGAVDVDIVDDTFWQDVLTSDFWGPVDRYTLVGLRGGVRWPDAGVELDLQVTNLLDDPIRQHIYADIIERRVSAGLGWTWGAP